MPQGFPQSGVLARALAHQLAEATVRAPVTGWRRRVDAIRQGLTTHGAAAAAHEQQAVARALRARQLRPRRIAVIGSNGGVGTTTTSVLLASVLSAARDDQTLLLSVHNDASDGAARLAVPLAPSVTEVLAGLRRHGRIPPTPVTRTGLRVLSAPPPGSPAVDAGLDALLEVAAAGHASVVVDAGVAGQIADLTALTELFDTVVLVCATATASLAAAKAVLARWPSDSGRDGPGVHREDSTEHGSGMPRRRGRADRPTGTAARLIVVPVRSRAVCGGAVSAWITQLSADQDLTHVIAHDPELARGRAIDLGTLSGQTLTATLRLGADIMGRR